MCWKATYGACVMIPSGPGEHLFTVALGPAILDGYGDSPQVVIVSFSSIKKGIPYDESCKVIAGTHPFITRDSFVYYREPRIYSAQELEERVASGQWRAQDSCSPELMQKIISGFRSSKRLPRYFNAILDALQIP